MLNSGWVRLHLALCIKAWTLSPCTWYSPSKQGSVPTESRLPMCAEAMAKTWNLTKLPRHGGNCHCLSTWMDLLKLRLAIVEASKLWQSTSHWWHLTGGKTETFSLKSLKLWLMRKHREYPCCSMMWHLHGPEEPGEVKWLVWGQQLMRCRSGAELGL